MKMVLFGMISIEIGFLLLLLFWFVLFEFNISEQCGSRYWIQTIFKVHLQNGDKKKGFFAFWESRHLQWPSLWWIFQIHIKNTSKLRGFCSENRHFYREFAHKIPMILHIQFVPENSIERSSSANVFNGTALFDGYSNNLANFDRATMWSVFLVLFLHTATGSEFETGARKKSCSQTILNLS